MKRILIPLLVLSVVLFSCKKKEIQPLPTSNSPVFFLEGEFDGQTISHNAGDNGMAMSSGVEERRGVNYAYANFSDGYTSYKFGLFDGNVALPGNIKDYAAGDTLYFAQQSTDVLASFSPSQMTNGYKVQYVKWFANDEQIGINTATISEPGVYNVRGEFKFTNGPLKFVTNRMYLGFENDVDFSVHHIVTDPHDLKLWIEGDKSNIDSIQWFLDGQLEWTGETCSKDIGNVTKDVTAKVFYNNGAVQQKTIVVDGGFEGYYIEDFSVFEVSNQPANWDYHVGIEVEQDGVTYTSFDSAVNAGYLVIKKAELYKHPTTGVEMIRLEADIETELMSNSTGQIIQTKLHTILGFPIPN